MEGFIENFLAFSVCDWPIHWAKRDFKTYYNIFLLPFAQFEKTIDQRILRNPTLNKVDYFGYLQY
jgi:hypothetical protein